MSTTAQALYQRRRLTVANYHHMGKSGIFQEDERVELIEGEIVQMPPIGSPHAGPVSQLSQMLRETVGRQAVVSVQNPVILDDYSEPLPDITLLKRRSDFYKSSHPRPEDVLLIIEVSDTTLRYDREVKVPLYARHGIPEVWIVDLANDCLQVFRDPLEASYQDCQTLAVSDSITPLTVPQCTIHLAGLFKRS